MDAPNGVTRYQQMVDTAQASIARRLRWASMHWGVEDVHSDAWPHIAAAAIDGLCVCDKNPATTEGPLEECPVHGRDIDDWIAMGRRNALIEAVAALVQASPPTNYGMRYDGTEEPLASAYVEGWHDAWSALQQLINPLPDGEKHEPVLMVTAQSVLDALTTIEANDSVQSGGYGKASRDAVDLISRRVLGRRWSRD